jgi:hypothetical protein
MTKIDFPGFPGPDFGILKFHDFPGFPGPYEPCSINMRRNQILLQVEAILLLVLLHL